MRLKLAIQKSGRLNEDSMRLLKECGIDIGNGVNKLKADATKIKAQISKLSKAAKLVGNDKLYNTIELLLANLASVEEVLDDISN
jgi:ATP phosphoribosyltransferase